MLYVALTSFDVLLGVQGVLDYIFKAMMLGSFAIGVVGAWYLKVREPKKYERLESSLGDQTA
ncbi:hypothetical protein D3C85_1880160 [compost metagenome]